MRLGLALLFAATAFAQSDPFPTLTSTIETTMRQQHIPGFAIGIVQNGKPPDVASSWRANSDFPHQSTADAGRRPGGSRTWRRT